MKPVHEDRLKIYDQNRHYVWYRGVPCFLFGCNQGWSTSLQDLEHDYRHEFDRLQQAGGNLVRITPFLTVTTDDPARHDPVRNNLPWRCDSQGGGRYSLDLTRDGGNPSFWSRLADLVRDAWERDIVISFEVWDLYGPARGAGCERGDRWGSHPFYPGNSADLTGSDALAAETDLKDIAFCRTVTGTGYDRARGFQEQYVTKLLEILSPYPNVIYCITNETSAEKVWSDYWIRFIRQYFAERWPGHPVVAGEMPREFAFVQNFHIEDMVSDSDYDFGDASQYCKGYGPKEVEITKSTLRKHYGDMAVQPEYTKPITCMKIYNWDCPSAIWMRMFSGAATARYHRYVERFPVTEETKARSLPPADVQLEYVRHVATFLNETGFQPWEMLPAHERVTGSVGVSATAAMSDPDCRTIALLLYSEEPSPTRSVTLTIPPGLYHGFFYSTTRGYRSADVQVKVTDGTTTLVAPTDPAHQQTVLYLQIS